MAAHTKKRLLLANKLRPNDGPNFELKEKAAIEAPEHLEVSRLHLMNQRSLGLICKLEKREIETGLEEIVFTNRLIEISEQQKELLMSQPTVVASQQTTVLVGSGSSILPLYAFCQSIVYFYPPRESKGSSLRLLNQHA